jgi:hypothetical protein
LINTAFGNIQTVSDGEISASAAEETRAVCSRIGGKSENREYDVTGKEVTI